MRTLAFVLLALASVALVSCGESRVDQIDSQIDDLQREIQVLEPFGYDVRELEEKRDALRAERAALLSASDANAADHVENTPVHSESAAIAMVKDHVRTLADVPAQILPLARALDAGEGLATSARWESDEMRWVVTIDRWEFIFHEPTEIVVLLRVVPGTPAPG